MNNQQHCNTEQTAHGYPLLRTPPLQKTSLQNASSTNWLRLESGAGGLSSTLLAFAQVAPSIFYQSVTAFLHKRLHLLKDMEHSQQYLKI